MMARHARRVYESIILLQSCNSISEEPRPVVHYYKGKDTAGNLPQVRALRPTSAYTTSMMACCRSYKPKDQEMTDANLEPRRTMTSSSSRTWPHYASNIKTIQTVIYKQPSQQRSRNAPLVGLPPDAHCNTLWTA